MIDEEVAFEIGLVSDRTWQVHGAHGSNTSSRYVAKLILPVTDVMGRSVALGMPMECTGIPKLREQHREFGVEVVGILGRNFLQFCQLLIDGEKGEVGVTISEAVTRPRT